MIVPKLAAPKVLCGSAEVGVIQGIEEFSTNLKQFAFSEVHIANEREVEIRIAWSTQKISASVSKLIVCRLGKRSGVRTNVEHAR